MIYRDDFSYLEYWWIGRFFAFRWLIAVNIFFCRFIADENVKLNFPELTIFVTILNYFLPLIIS